MPRLYDLTLTSPTTGAVASRTDGTPYRWGTNIGGTYDPNALNITFDCFVTYFAQPTGASTITLEGVSLADLQQGSQFAGLNLTLSGGMTTGLPLANPKQGGVLLRGQIWQSWGNWVGTEQALTFVVQAAPYTLSTPGNFTLIWKKGQTLSSALATTFSIVFPSMTQRISISNDLVAGQDMPGVYPTLESFASAIKQATMSSSEQGVDIWINAGTVYASDHSSSATTPVSPIALNFQDLIGQPTYIGQNLIQIATVLRADIGVGNYVMFPTGLQNAGASPGFVSTSRDALPSSLKYKTTMQGQFLIQSMRHIGQSRSADGTQWTTIFNAVPTSPATASN